jgi:hypothetical protein
MLCISLCAAGAIFSQKVQAQKREPKSKVVPIDNRAENRGVWIWS